MSNKKSKKIKHMNNDELLKGYAKLVLLQKQLADVQAIKGLRDITWKLADFKDEIIARMKNNKNL